VNEKISTTRRRSRLLFAGPEFRYELLHALVEHVDDESLVVAARQPLHGGGEAQSVILRRVVLPPAEERRQRAAEEVQLSQRLSHPNITPVLGLEEHEGVPYVVTEYMPGCFLTSAMDTALLQERNLSPALSCYVAAEVAEVLHYLHHLTGEGGRPLRLVHRAVCPASIRLGNEGQVKLGHFGMAWVEGVERLRTPPRVLRAELGYAAPEVFRCEPVDARADLYSLGLVLLEMLTGYYPFDPSDISLPPGEPPEAERYSAEVQVERSAWATPGELAQRVWRFGPEDVERAARELPEPLKRVLHKALRHHPADRYQTGAELRDELRAYLSRLGKPFGPAEAAAELKALLEPLWPGEMAAYPVEEHVFPTPEETEQQQTLH
jgi:eukaryotic-like serine/threonine-protein kinase